LIQTGKGQRLTLVSMSGLRVVDPALREAGLRLPGLARRASALSELPPLGLLTIAANVPDSWHVTLVCDDGTKDEKEVIEEIVASAPAVVAFSTLTPAADRAARLSGSLRHQGVTTAVGGLHATAAPEWCQRSFDVVLVGDGEAILPEFLQDFISGELRKRYQPSTPFSLHAAPIPRWDLWPQSDAPRYTVQTMRGCPWACSFCAASRLLGPARMKPTEIIVRELAAISDRQHRPWIELADDNTFACDQDRIDMLEALRSVGARWFTESDWLIGKRPELLRQIARAGCRQILIGLESSVFRYPGMGRKSATWNEMLDAVQTIQAAGIVVNACFIVGANGETPASIERLGQFLDTAPFGEIQLTLQTPFPGTRLYQDLMKQGRLLNGDFSKYTLFDVVYRPDQMTPDELQRSFNELIRVVFRPEQQSRRDQIVRSIRGIQRRVRHSPL